LKASLQHKPVVLFVQETIIVDALLVATGRSPNVSGLGLDAAGVQYSAKDGIKVRHPVTLKDFDTLPKCIERFCRR